MLSANRHDHARKLTTLAFVDRHRVGELKFIKLSRLIFDETIRLEANSDSQRIGVDANDMAQVAIEDVFVVIVVGLDDFVPSTKGSAKPFQFGLKLTSRIQGVLQPLV